MAGCCEGFYGVTFLRASGFILALLLGAMQCLGFDTVLCKEVARPLSSALKDPIGPPKREKAACAAFSLWGFGVVASGVNKPPKGFWCLLGARCLQQVPRFDRLAACCARKVWAVAGIQNGA